MNLGQGEKYEPNQHSYNRSHDRFCLFDIALCRLWETYRRNLDSFWTVGLIGTEISFTIMGLDGSTHEGFA
jgi:hypothetical protein